jgi:ribosomal protein S18 acetylase RimI-like enzyme
MTTDRTRAVSTASLTFRVATTDDVSAIVALVQSAYRGEASRAGWTTEADILDGQRTDRAEVAGLIAAAGSRILLGERHGELLASAHLEKQGEHGHFGMFAVRPGAQAGGVGTAMLAEAERMARADWGCDEMQMAVITLRTELIAWYERRGYVRSGLFRPFPYGKPRFGIPKRDDLRLTVLCKRLR